uniref:Transmembrane protein 115 n=1 Tax=Pyramimonas obovata TaxID=1411642 RepID=A0A7S0RHA0_9CHLO|mmetsp:Transcript_34119/g.74602  ORF Transcript_34119/g.74602 Transcript_34119/m.74602 type:complete len:407 (+) Transcript_34119:133-1353(+)|eukprot:CAMPEP_0118935406 /NCGR_PEP_ID=MMETSP1169-20130426/15625_1 /TAXON_ID=36882 /ORGANISM="Pyramimonas obovata, Strain CCMP722" /LENGTH=406 /DNA_ID=CAMNT_0006878445 /DNA_START=110 /DNA_END=1330 /DNA_ORIENTATION=-
MRSNERDVAIYVDDATVNATPPSIHEIWGQTRSFVQGSTFTSKVVSVVLVCGYVLYFLFPSSALTLALIPDRTLPGVWNLVTAGFFEMSLISVCFDTAALMLLGRTVEPIWGAGEFVKYIMVVNVGAGFATFMSMYTLYVITRDNFYLYAKFGGFHGVIAGLLVAVKQLIPEEELGPAAIPYLRLRAKRLLGLYVLGATLLCIVSGGQHHHIGFYFFTLLGCYIGWLYLRFFQVTPAGVGDPSAEFAFHMLFPEPVQPLMQRVSDQFFSVFCAPAVPTHGTAAVPITPAYVSVGPRSPRNGSKSDANRRKELSDRGERLLQERLGDVSATIEKLDQATGTTMKRVGSSVFEKLSQREGASSQAAGESTLQPTGKPLRRVGSSTGSGFEADSAATAVQLSAMSAVAG